MLKTQEIPAGARAAEAYQFLMDRLVDGFLRPGDDIRITAIARELGLSPTPVREALTRLAEAGVVVKYGARGYRAAALLTAEEEARLLDARAAIEPALAEIACQAADAGLIAALAASVNEHRQRINSAPNFAHDRIASEAFHRLLADHAPNQFLARAYESLGAHVHRFRRLGNSGVSDAGEALAEHEAILARFSARDAAGARGAMHAHIEAMRRRLRGR